MSSRWIVAVVVLLSVAVVVLVGRNLYPPVPEPTICHFEEQFKEGKLDGWLWTSLEVTEAEAEIHARHVRDHAGLCVGNEQPPTTLEPFEPPDPEPDDLPPIAIPVCHCATPYGACVDMRMVREAARLHALRHDYDLIGRGCASATEEDLALRRVLFRPERIEANGAATLSMADRSAWRERMQGRIVNGSHSHQGVGGRVRDRRHRWSDLLPNPGRSDPADSGADRLGAGA